MNDQIAGELLSSSLYVTYVSARARGNNPLNSFMSATGMTSTEVVTLVESRGIGAVSRGGNPSGDDITFTSSGTTPSGSVVRVSPSNGFTFESAFSSKPASNLNVKEEIKKRHLRKNERDAHHKPASDVVECGKGEVCKNACTLELEDIIIKYK